MKSKLFTNVESIRDGDWYKISAKEMVKIEHIVEELCAAGKACPWYKSFIELKKVYEASWKIWIDHGELAEKEWQKYDLILEKKKEDDSKKKI